MHALNIQKTFSNTPMNGYAAKLLAQISPYTLCREDPKDSFKAIPKLLHSTQNPLLFHPSVTLLAINTIKINMTSATHPRMKNGIMGSNVVLTLRMLKIKRLSTDIM